MHHPARSTILRAVALALLLVGPGGAAQAQIAPPGTGARGG